jgi:hypothetical protein
MMIVDILGPPSIRKTLSKFWREFQQVLDKFDGRKKKLIFFKLRLKVLL